MSPRVTRRTQPKPPRWYDIVDVRLRWLAGVIVALGVVGGGVSWGWDRAHQQFSDTDQRIQDNLDKLIEWQQSEQKRESDEKAREAERARIKECLDSGKPPEECL